LKINIKYDQFKKKEDDIGWNSILANLQHRKEKDTSKKKHKKTKININKYNENLITIDEKQIENKQVDFESKDDDIISTNQSSM